MDNNNLPPSPEQQPQPQQPLPEQPLQPNPIMTQAAPPENKESKAGIWLAVGLVLIVITVGGIYWFLSNQQSNEIADTPTVQDTPITKAPENLDQELESIDVQASGEAEFDALDSDLQNL